MSDEDLEAERDEYQSAGNLCCRAQPGAGNGTKINAAKAQDRGRAADHCAGNENRDPEDRQGYPGGGIDAGGGGGC